MAKKLFFIYKKKMDFQIESYHRITIVCGGYLVHLKQIIMIDIFLFHI